MLKKFFISMLGTIAGLWFSAIVGILVIVSVVSSIVASGKPESKVSDTSILYIDLKGDMSERFQPGNILSLITETEAGGDALIDILDAVRLAACDKHIKGIYINADQGVASSASREEIVKALVDFKKSGKWIYAYSDNFAQGDYMISAVADSVYVNPMGEVGVHGVAMQVPFFTGLLDKLGVKVQIVRVGTFKSAVEPFFATQMSEASRLQNTQMVDSVWAYTRGVIADGRSIAAATVQQWADSIMSFWPAQRVADAGAVTALRYRRQVEQLLRDKLGLDSDAKLPLVSPTEYMTTKTAYSADKKHVAVLFAVGDIVDTGNDGIVGSEMTPQIIKLADDDNVAGLVLRVNSGGGSAFASEQIWEALEYFKSKDKPFYVSMGDMAASGGYYISCGADTIFADRTTLTGSIGVFGMIPDLSGLVTGKAGVTFSLVESNPNAALMSLVTPMPAGQLQALQASVNNIYEVFTKRVADGRHMSQDSVKAIAEGRVWVGGRAIEIGLVDRIGGIDQAVTAMTDKLGLERKAVVYYPEVKDEMLAQIIREAGKNMTVGGITIDRTTLQAMREIEYLRTAARVQARLTPFELQ